MKILVVDDEEIVLNTIRFHLESEGHLVITSADGREAIELIRNEEPDVIILDIMMPFMSGLELLEMVKSENKNIPAILISALDEIEVIETSLSIGADDFIIKPVNMDELSIRIKRVLEQD